MVETESFALSHKFSIRKAASPGRPVHFMVLLYMYYREAFPIPRNAISILLRTGVIISDNNDNIRTWVGYTRNGTNALLFVFPIQKDCDEFLENYITLYALLMVFSRRDTDKEREKNDSRT